MLQAKGRIFLHPGGAGFHAPPPTSRPPTKAYDRQSYVLVMSESDDIVRFMKIHLNRFFSHVVVCRTAADSLTALKGREFDLLIADASPAKKQNVDFLKKIGAVWRSLPVILLSEEGASRPPEEYGQSLVVNVIEPPFDLDTMHCAIRRALNIRPSLRELEPLIPLKSAIGDVVRTTAIPDGCGRMGELILKIRNGLVEEIED